MGLLNGTAQQYYGGNDFGNYQFTSLNDIINQFMLIYVGEDKIIPKAKRLDVAFHAQRALAELSFDTFKSCKSQEITVPPSLQMILPQDYVNYTKISSVDSAGIKHILYPTSKTSSPTNLYQNTDGSYYSNLVLNGDFNEGINFYTPIATSPGTGIPNSWYISNLSTGGAGVNGGFGDTQLNLSSSSDGLLISSNGIGTKLYPRLHQDVILEGGQSYTFSYNVTSVSSNFSTSSKIRITDSMQSGASTAVEILGSNIVVGTNSVDFIWDGSTGADAKITILISAANTIAQSIGIKDIVLVKNDNTGTPALSSSTLYAASEKYNDAINNVDDSTTWSRYKSHTPSENNNNDYEDDTYWPMNGQRYGLDPQHAQANGSFYIDCVSGKIHFSSNISGKTVILDYISDSLGTDGEMQVHKFAEEAMYKWMSHAILAGRSNIPEYQVNRFKKERFAAIRTAKLRLSNIKLEEITQIMRGKSKQIKH
tara:strand:+ start:634 stop:2076 length:1443 start_codon:yes stop_codon:yes gene_type:complete